MEPVLRKLFEAWRTGGPEKWNQEAAQLPFYADYRSVALKITMSSSSRIDDVRRAVVRLKGTSRGEFEEFLFVSVPASALGALSDNKWVKMMHLDTAMDAPQSKENTP